ncbi:3-hydroxyacyl-CoA dehydrogenase NAD-binding protein [Natrialba hulunbeirensis JCM 10989]|uniref:3-hydroxyacyl-CoA dehydrogenase NAD-binding protein n=1 Tax=Natrialba hulunbeirensis JCM 10989 TaxID=1227493 RepID=M0A2M0_9EURY|nr:3-hydroxyacyl-CoA dehydrogenase NAD-binding domain-containing protein [Natrialba hulunbeirensis]ELY92102.1 3-hydroxyacyl-CoA dehydrogenase NAD-binding protein [Natrialba hulunbeirensis JCM 10989]
MDTELDRRSDPQSDSETPSTVTIIGAGSMGHGFVVQFLRSGLSVRLVDHRESNLERARERARNAANFLAEQDLAALEPAAVEGDVTYTIDRARAVADADVVLETISEDLDAKRELFSALADEADGDALLASNTSGLPITDIAAGAPDAAARIIGCHWWYPPYLLRPVEVIPGEQTSERTVERLRSFLAAVDRDPIMVERDVPGFVWNRVQHAVIRECLHIVEEGIASAEDVNRAIRDGYATRTAAIGPLETVDIAGLELFQTSANDIYPDLTDRDDANPLYGERIDEGRTGIEAGAGFFDYDREPDEITGRRDERVAAIRRALGAFGDGSDATRDTDTSVADFGGDPTEPGQPE